MIVQRALNVGVVSGGADRPGADHARFPHLFERQQAQVIDDMRPLGTAAQSVGCRDEARRLFQTEGTSSPNSSRRWGAPHSAMQHD